MRPIVWLRREMEQWNKELEKDIQDLQKTNTDLQKDKQNLEKCNTDLQKDKQDLQKQMENGVKHLIHKLQEEGTSREKAISTIEEFFSLTAAEAEEKVKRYWKE